jgi:membrane protein
MLVGVLSELKKRFIQDRVFDLAAQMAYYFLSSLFPLLFLFFSLLGYLPFSSEQVLDLIRPYAPPTIYELIRSNLIHILDRRHDGVLTFGLLASIYLASLAFQSIIYALNKAYRVKETRSLLADILLGIFMMIGLFLAIVISLVLPIIVDLAMMFLFQLTEGVPKGIEILSIMKWLVSSVILWFIFLGLYTLVPNTKVKFLQALPGSIFATMGWQISSVGFSYYVSINDYSLLYGNLGGIMILIGWFYISALVLILGGQLNAVLCQWSKK